MSICAELLAVNPFVQAYSQSDFIGKTIFLSLISLSLITWITLLYKVMLIKKSHDRSMEFQNAFEENRHTPLQIIYKGEESPFLTLYQKLKNYAVDLLKKNRRFGFQTDSGSYLSHQDIDLIGSYVMITISAETKKLESYLYILSTIVSLAPFLGLLGTVWGILITFAEPTGSAIGGSSVLSGISLALVTTVLGLINAIPAIVGHSYLKNAISDLEISMEEFASNILSVLELQYRFVEKKE